MRRALLAGALASSGCLATDTSVVLAPETDGTTSVSAPTTSPALTETDPATSVGPTTSSNGASESTVSESMAGPGSTTGSTGTGSGPPSESSSSTGENPDVAGSPCASGQKICANVRLDGEPAGLCGDTLELKGITTEIEPGVWQIEDCGACELCGGATYTVEFLAPGEWGPRRVPLCARIAVDFARSSEAAYACAFVGLSVWEDDGLGEDPAPLYVAASIEPDAPVSVADLIVDAENVMPQECQMTSCCPMAPGDYQLRFAGAGIAPAISLAEKETAAGVGAFGRSYDIRNENSHADRECDRVPRFDWVMLRD